MPYGIPVFVRVQQAGPLQKHKPSPPINLYPIPGLEAQGGIPASDDGRDAQLPGDDGRVGERRADICNNGCRAGKIRVQPMLVWAVTRISPGWS